MRQPLKSACGLGNLKAFEIAPRILAPAEAPWQIGTTKAADLRQQSLSYRLPEVPAVA
jgi:hypothetical protein